MYRWLWLILALAAAALGLVLGMLNPQAVQPDLLAFKPEIALGTALAGAFAAGVFAGLVLAVLLFVLPARWRRRGAGGRGLKRPDA